MENLESKVSLTEILKCFSRWSRLWYMLQGLVYFEESNGGLTTKGYKTMLSSKLHGPYVTYDAHGILYQTEYKNGLLNSYWERNEDGRLVAVFPITIKSG